MVPARNDLLDQDRVHQIRDEGIALRQSGTTTDRQLLRSARSPFALDARRCR